MNRTEGALNLFSDYVKKTAEQFPEHPVFIFNGQRTSYKEFNDKVEILARYLLKKGIKRHDRIAYILAPQPEFLYLYMAAARIGAIVVGLGIKHTPREMEYIINNSQPSLIVTRAELQGIDYQDQLSKFIDKYSSVREIIVTGGSPKMSNAVSFDEIMSGDYSDLDQLLAESEAKVETDDGLIIIYTSGTTGDPKGALISHKNIIHMALVAADEYGGTRDSIWMAHCPVNHVAMATEIVGVSFVTGGTQVLLEEFSPVKTLELIEKERVTHMGQVPTMYAMEFALPNYDDYDKSSLQMLMIGGSMAQESLVNKMFSTMTTNCYNSLAMTETTGLTTYTPKGSSPQVITSTVGKCSPEWELKLVDENRQTVEKGEIGEIAYRGAIVIKEYFNLPEATAASRDSEGWFYSGDMAYEDEDGLLRMVGRNKEMFITGGNNVYPAEIENLLTSYEGIVMAACMPIPDEIWGEVGRAYLILRPGYELNEENLVNYLKENLDKYKIPKEFIISDSLPLTGLGKIEKKTIQKQIKEEFAKS